MAVHGRLEAQSPGAHGVKKTDLMKCYLANQLIF